MARSHPSAGGGASSRRRRPSGWAGLPPFAHDGPERRIVRPQDPAEQKDSYSGKKKDHTVKNVLLVNALLLTLFLSDTYGGRTHDKLIADATPYPLPAGSRLLQDLGFLAFTLPQVELLMPTKKPRSQELTLEQQLANQALHDRRLRIEHVNSSVKRCRIVKDRIRLWKGGIRDLIMDLCCALHNSGCVFSLAADDLIEINSNDPSETPHSAGALVLWPRPRLFLGAYALWPRPERPRV
jgi:hypothetical protein